jgi:UDP-glucuronate 4-epimerase
MPMQGGDVKKSHADVDDLVKDFEYSPKWNIQNGIKSFIQWYIDYYKVRLTK